MKFKLDDRVVLVKNYSYIPNVGLRGTVVKFLRNDVENMYGILWDKDTHNDPIDDVFIDPPDWDTFEGELEFESVYDSELYKAMEEK